MAGAMLGSTVQVHLNRTCNLTCSHCYSMSGPQYREALDPEVVMTFLGQARRQGYTTLSLSGGEPFLYDGLGEVVAEARSLGLATTVVTNGTLLNTEARRSLAARFDLLAVSVDGPPDLHNALRGSPTAYQRMLRGLEVVRDAGLRFGIIHTITRDSLPDLPWLADFAAANGAALLQLHPLGIVGAATTLEDKRLGGEDMARAYLVGLGLRRNYQGRMHVHIDVFNRDIVRNNLGLIIPRMMTCGQQTRLADVLNPLVLMSNGDLSPICHAMHPAFRLGNIHAATLDELGDAFLQQGLARFQAFCGSLWNELDEGDIWPYFNWYENLESASFRYGETQAPRVLRQVA